MVANGVSIVTTTWNERENVGKLIPAMRNVLQQIPHEIIVVDDNSSDGTIQTAQRLADVAVTSSILKIVLPFSDSAESSRLSFLVSPALTFSVSLASIILTNNT